MRRNSLRFPAHLTVLAMALALALTLAFTGVASAAPVRATQQQLPAASNCLSAAPARQIVLVAHPAKVAVTVNCYPVSPSQFVYLQAAWGDGSTTLYPVCVEVCRVPPFVITTSHTYTAVGDYHPLFCLVPTPISVVAACTSAEILVLPPV